MCAHYMTVMKSPFRFGQEATASELVDREAEPAEVLWTIEGQERLFLIGPRRFGKTSILSSATAIARARGDIVVQVNAEEFGTLSALAGAIAEQAGEQLRSPLAAAVEHGCPRRTRGARRGSRSGGRAHHRRIPARRQGRGLDAGHQLRAVVQRHRHVAYVFASSAESVMIAMTGDHGRPFYRLGARRFLGLIPRADFRERVIRGFATIPLAIAVDAVEAILDLARDVPYGVQRLANVTWRTAVVEGRTTDVDRAYVEAALTQLLQTEAPD